MVGLYGGLYAFVKPQRKSPDFAAGAFEYFLRRTQAHSPRPTRWHHAIPASLFCRRQHVLALGAGADPAHLPGPL